MTEVKIAGSDGASIAKDKERAVRRKRRRKPAAAPGVPTAPAGRAEELNAGGRALLGREDKPRRMRPEPADDASIEDPLRDWPED
ncbi:MAG: hypothetical protein OEV81_13235 [Betaproteobacteria bacterium]|nr:hypothetical protein [Betaproteobacteria bacterium]MDH5221861.1 hypothetical protein [Betaproteobacteria bacterium]MDH5350971.1 hypothetical protein [Betaproteobacteria bacterium]